MFKHLIHDGYSFYGITDTGALLWYRDINNNGTVGWAPASGKQIGVGWGKFIRIFPGSDPGEIYAVEPSGNLLWYRDLARDGSNGAGGNSGWDHSSGQTIGEGWNAVLHVFPGPNGVIYAVKPTGELLWFKDLKQTAPRWANKGVGKQIGVGWNNAAKIVSSRHAAPPQSFNDYVIYFVKPNGDLLWYHDDRADGSNDPKGMSGWAHASGSRIGVGWDVATMLMDHKSGAISVVDCSYATRLAVEPFPETLIEIDGSDGTIRLAQGYRLTVTGRSGTVVSDVSPPLLPWASRPWHNIQESVLAIQRNWVDCLASGKEPATSGADNLKTFALVEAAYAGAASLEPVQIDDLLK